MEKSSEKTLFILTPYSPAMLQWKPVEQELQKEHMPGYNFDISFEHLEQNMAATAIDLFDRILKYRNFEGRAQRTITDQVYKSSRHLLYLYYGTGVNPRPHIEALMEKMEVQLSYDVLLDAL